MFTFLGSFSVQYKDSTCADYANSLLNDTLYTIRYAIRTSKKKCREEDEQGHLFAL